MSSAIAPEAAIRFNGVSKRYGKSPALLRLDLVVPAGATFGLVGANGAGKTTLIKCLLDFCDHEEGSIEIFGVSGLQPAARRRLAFLPERFTPPYYLTGSDFLRFMARMYGARFDAPAALETLASLDLAQDVLDKAVRHFSKGMTQKLGLAACLMSGRDLLVLDEPTSGLDPKARALLKDALRRVRAAGGTIFLTSHALADVDELCDEMAVLHDGTLRFSGTPAGLVKRHGAANLEQAYLASII
jgi:ABC-2 type transport system ATP-binding protein